MSYLKAIIKNSFFWLIVFLAIGLWIYSRPTPLEEVDAAFINKLLDTSPSIIRLSTVYTEPWNYVCAVNDFDLSSMYPDIQSFTGKYEKIPRRLPSVQDGYPVILFAGKEYYMFFKLPVSVLEMNANGDCYDSDVKVQVITDADQAEINFIGEKISSHKAPSPEKLRQR